MTYYVLAILKNQSLKVYSKLSEPYTSKDEYMFVDFETHISKNKDDRFLVKFETPDQAQEYSYSAHIGYNQILKVVSDQNGVIHSYQSTFNRDSQRHFM